MNQNNLTNGFFVIFLVVFLVLGCLMPSRNFKTVRSGCITRDGSKIALTDNLANFLLYVPKGADKYRLILDGKTGKVIWKDLNSSDQLVCSEDNSIISVSESRAQWIEGNQEIVFSKQSEYGRTNFIGMTDKDTVIREDRPYYAKKDFKGKSSSVRSYNTFPTFLVDKLGENNTKIITLSESDLEGASQEDSFNYYFEKNRIIMYSGKKLYAIDVVNGKAKVIFENYKDFQKSREKVDKYDALETLQEQKDGFIEIYEGKGDEAKVINQISKKDLSAKVIQIIDCCNNGLNLLYWESDNYLKVAQINQLTGQVIWKSDSLLSTNVK